MYNESMTKKQKQLFYLEYTLLFFLVAGLAIYYHYSQGKSLIDANGDGFRQHFRALLYYSNMLKEMFRALLQGHFTLPQWDPVIGEGSDILHAFHYYGIGDIFTFFSFLCPERYMYLYYDAATFARMYCAGIAFSVLCFYQKKNDRPIVLACSLLYAFCALNVMHMKGHVFFLSASVWLPLIITGVEMIIQDDRPFLLPLAVMFAALSNIYFFYINVVATVLFVAVRLLFLETDWNEKGSILMKITVYSFLGTLMGGVIFLPMLLVMAGSTRMSVSVNAALLYDLRDYLELLCKLSFSNGSYFGSFSVLWLPAYVCLFAKRRNRTLIALTLTALLFVCLPKLSAVFNAFVYPTSRWFYAISLLALYVIADHFCDKESAGKCLIAQIALCIGYYAFCLCYDRPIWQVHVLMAVMTVAVIFFNGLNGKQKLRSLVCLASAIAFLLFQMYYYLDANYWDLANHGMTIAKIDRALAGETVALDTIEDDSFYRYSGNELLENATIQGKHSSTQYYWSIINDAIVEYRTQLGNSDRGLFHIGNYNGRFAQNALAGVRYYINRPGEDVPYGFEYLDRVDNYEIWQSRYSLPLLFVYDNYLLPEEWEKLDPAGKNETLLQAGLVDHEIEGIEAKPIRLENTEIPYMRSNGKGIEIDEHRILAKGKDAKLSLAAKSDQAGEYYVMIQGLYSAKMTAYIHVRYQDAVKYFIFKGSDNEHYTDRHDYLVDLGYFEGIDGEIEMDFADGGDYSYESLKIICQPLDYQIECIGKRKEIRIEELDVVKNRVTAKTVTDADKLACFSIPYSKGWKAYIDGERAELLRCELQYMALKLPRGEHLIELKYSTPGLKAGALLSAAGILAYVLLLKKRQK